MLKTENIRFEPLQTRYLKALEKLFCENTTVMQSTLKGRVFTKKEFEVLLQKEFIHCKDDHLGFRCVVSRSDGKLMGVSGLHEYNYLGKTYHEFGCILDQEYWGKGFATEIGNFWFAYAKEQLGLSALVATVSPSNNASKRVLEKLEMTPLGKLNSKERGLKLIVIKQI